MPCDERSVPATTGTEPEPNVRGTDTDDLRRDLRDCAVVVDRGVADAQLVRRAVAPVREELADRRVFLRAELVGVRRQAEIAVVERLKLVRSPSL